MATAGLLAEQGGGPGGQRGEAREDVADEQESISGTYPTRGPFRALVGPLPAYINALEAQHVDGTLVVTVLLPEFVPAHWWEQLLHTHSALRLKGALWFRSRTAVGSVPYHLHA